MPLQFHQAVQNMDVWCADSANISFVISCTGFRGRHGFLASWRPLYTGKGAVKVSGSPFSTFVEAEAACNIMLVELERFGPAASLKQRASQMPYIQYPTE